MARINLEDSIFKDNRFINLCITLGSRTMALGVLVETWQFAQKHWFPYKKGIPKSVWAEQNLNSAIIDCGLAVVEGDAIYIKGSEENFAWMFAHMERSKAGGIASAKARKLKNGTAQPAASSKREPDPKQCFDKTRSSSKPLTPPLTLSLSPSLPQTHTHSRKNKDSAPRSSPKAPEVPGSNLLIAHYCDSWRAAYKTEKSPPISKATASQFKGLVQDFGLERAKELVSGYLKMPDSWYLTKRHDIWTLRQNLNAVSHFIETGKLVSRGEIRDVDSKIGQMNLRKEIKEKGV